MATKTLKVTGSISCTFTYTVTTTEQYVTVKVTKVSWANTRSGGLTAAATWTATAGGASVTGTAAKGASSWSKDASITRKFERMDGSDYSDEVKISASILASSYYSSSGSIVVNVPKLKSYAVTYNGNGSTGGSTASQTKWYGIALTLRANGFTRDGHTFHRWNTKADGTGTWYSPGASYTGNAALALYAIWTPVVYFDANGGELGSVPASATKTYGSPYVIPTATPTRVDHEFLGWATSATAAQKDDRYDPGDSYTGEETLRLYAVWKRVYREPGLSIAACYRCDSTGADDDEGAYLAVEATYELFDTEAAGGSANAPSWSLTCNGATATSPASGGTGLSGSATFILAANLDTETAYTATLTLSDIGGASRAVTVSYRIGTAYYPIDVLGDGKLHQPTADTAVDASKTYYTRSGSGTQADPYVYTAVEFPVTAELPTYYEASGPRPGRGVAIGKAATHEGLDVGMPTFAYGEEWPPAFAMAARPASAASLPCLPCFVADLSDASLWLYDAQGSAVQLGGTQPEPVAVVSETGGMTSVPHGTYQAIQAITVPAGKWLAVISVYSQGNSTGYRSWTWSSASSITGQQFPGTYGLPAGPVAMYSSFAMFADVSAPTTYRVFGWQNCGSALNMRSHVTLVRISQ